LHQPADRWFVWTFCVVFALAAGIALRTSRGWLVANAHELHASRIFASIHLAWADVDDIVLGSTVDGYRYRPVRAYLRFSFYFVAGGVMGRTLRRRWIIVITRSGRRYLLYVPVGAYPESVDAAVVNETYRRLKMLWEQPLPRS
jgi:hypothetical protein